MKKVAFIMSLLVSISAQAEGFEIPEACREKLESFALKKEKERIKSKKETLASDFEVNTALTYKYPSTTLIMVRVVLQEPIEGRYVIYRSQLVTTKDVSKCNVAVRRQNAEACRYSRNEGPESLAEIQDMKFEFGEDIKPNSDLKKLTAVERNQIRIWLDAKNSSVTAIKDAINDTDEDELSTGTLTLPNGKTLTYYGAYGGDNAFGAFFVPGTTRNAGSNSDGFVCIK